MRKLISPGRLGFLIAVVAGILALYIATLYKLQIIEGNQNYELSTNSIVSHETVIAARGNLLDRYGRLLVSNRNCNNLLIDDNELLMGDIGGDEANAIILQMCRIIEENGDTHIDQLPITMTPPFEFTESISSWQNTLLQAWLADNGLEPDATATEIMARMRTRYGIDSNYTAEEMRIIAGVRYEVNVRYIIGTSDYIFAQDVSINTISALMEADIPGFEVQVSYIREYNTTYGAHILGYTGLMTGEEYEIYEDLGYPMNATVGKAGAELAFEELLHGSDGQAEITRTSEGIVTSTVYSSMPEPGNHVYLTIDIALQGVAESALANYIEETNTTRTENNALYEMTGEQDKIRELITGGAIVAVDVRTGEPLCVASYPTYNLDTFLDDYADLVSDEENRPLLNRALQGLYAPGSTFKPCVALAALTEGFIDGESEFTCTGIFDKYQDAGYAPRCTGIHGALTVSRALTYSCNVFFFSLGDTIGIRNIDDYAARLGLGVPTGIELYEETGHVASPEYKAEVQAGTFEEDWFSADTLLTSIGQSITSVTPIQLARYAAAIANSGTTYGCSILKSASSYDYSENVQEREPEVIDTVDAPDYVWDLIHEGMYGAAHDPGGTAYSTFYDFSPDVAAKTGTTQTGSGTNDAFFICYAPYDDPEIAVAVALENGAAGASLANLAREVLQYYFDFEQSTQQTEDELTLLH